MALHQVLIILRLVLTVRGGLCPLRHRCTEHTGWTEGPTSPGGSTVPLATDGGRLGALRRLGGATLPVTYYEVFVSRKNSPGYSVT